MLNNSDQQILWKFIRGDLSSPEFEQWLYSNENFENVLGNEFYLEVIATDFNDKSALCLLEKKLESFLRQTEPLNCECIALADNAVTDVGSEHCEKAYATLIEIKGYGKSRWWLSLNQCNKCSQYWLIAQESTINDIDLFKRIDTSVAHKVIQENKWPEHFQTFEELLISGKNNNRSVRFEDPFCNALVYTAHELKNERPDISTDEIAFLLNTDVNHVRELLKKSC